MKPPVFSPDIPRVSSSASLIEQMDLTRYFKVVALAGILLILALAGCKRSKPAKKPTADAKKPDPFARTVAGFQVIDITKPVERPCNLSRQVGAMGLAALKRSKWFRLQPKQTQNLHAFRGGANLLYMLSSNGSITPDATKGVLTIGIDLSLSREHPHSPGNEVLESVVRRHVPYERAKHGFIKAFTQKQLALALDEALMRAEILAKSRRLPLSALIARINHKDALIRDIAIQNLGFRKAKSAVLPLIRALKHPQKSVVLRVVGSLSSIGDARAIEPLAARVGAADNELKRALIFAIGDIGGPKAVKALKRLQGSTKDAKLQQAIRAAIQTANDSE